MASDTRRTQDEAESSPLRIGLLLDDVIVPAWVHAIVSEIDAGDLGSAHAVILNTPSAPTGPAERIRAKRSTLLYESYSRLDISLARQAPDAFARRSLENLLADVPRLVVKPRKTRFSDYFSEAENEEIRGQDLDVLLRFGFRILRGEILNAARHGVWSYHHGDPDRVRGGPPGFWEVMLDQPATGAVLQHLSEDLDGGTILERLIVPTNRISVRRNKNHLYWAAVPLVARALKRVRAGDPVEANKQIPETYDRPLYKKPTDRQFAPILGRFALQRLAGKVKSTASRSEWFVACQVTDPTAAIEAPLFRYQELRSPRGVYWADPFPIVVDEEKWVFVEEYSHEQRRGRISAVRIGDDLGVEEAVPALERPFHLSYPSIFEWSGSLWMTPESAASRSVDLYRCHRFPHDWRLERTLLPQIRGVDPTLLSYNDKWWMFVNQASPEATHAHDELYVYWAETPVGPWSPHPRNPVVSDARRARPAGHLFEHAGRLYRPGQDCTGHYGRAIAISHVHDLGEETYAEESVSRIEPKWMPGIVATHTINRAGSLAVVDGMRKAPFWTW